MSPIDEAVGRYSAAIGRVAACITAERHRVRPYISHSGRAYLYSLPLPVGLRANDGSRSGLRFTFQEVIQFGQGQSIPGSGSRGELRMDEYRLLDHIDRELLVYHWHPDAAGPDHPHLHVSASLDAQVDALTRREIALDKRHLTTGHVSLGAVVSMLITEFGVRPLRSDWQHRLADPATH